MAKCQNAKWHLPLATGNSRPQYNQGSMKGDTATEERGSGELLAQLISADLLSRMVVWFLMTRLALSRRLGRDRIDPLADPARRCSYVEVPTVPHRRY